MTGRCEHLGLLIGCLLAAGCQLGADQTPPFIGPTAIPLPSPSPVPAAEVTFVARPPAGTPQGTELALVLLDEITGFEFNRRTVPMSPGADGLWQTSTELPHGALQYYRYELINPPTPERDGLGNAVPARVALVQVGLRVDDVIASWSQAPTSTATGRAFGQLTGVDGSPLAEQIVVLGGRWAFSDGEGQFAFDGLPSGHHLLTTFSPDGMFRPAQQGVLVAQDGLTPIQLQMEQAALVRVTFEVTVPDDTVPGDPPRIAGNLRQFGQRFTDLPGGLRVAAQTMPAMIRADDTHYLWITQLPVGTHLRYKYTLGDGLWNAERTPEGFFHVREVTLPSEELLQVDTVSSWRGQHGSASLKVTAPSDTSLDDSLSIQLNPAAGFAPLVMYPLDGREWLFTLHGPLDLGSPLTYRYCRNLRCGAADDAATAGPVALGRQAALDARGTDIQDTIDRWQWWSAAAPSEGIVAPEIQPRPDMEVGVGFAPSFHPDWLPGMRQAMLDLSQNGANAVVLRPGWSILRAQPTPRLGLDPARAPFGDELVSLMQSAQASGLSVVLHPTLAYPAGDATTWLASAPASSEWWTAWFIEYRAFVRRFAELAEQGGAVRLVLGGPDAAPFLPEALEASGLEAVAEGAWRGLIAEIRSIYHGQLAFELEFGATLQQAPPFLGEFDAVQLFWHAPLGERPNLTLIEMREGARRLLDETLSQPPLASFPLVLSLGYRSVDGGAGGCAARLEADCPGPTAALAGVAEGIILPVDLQEQAWAVNAMLLEAHIRPQIVGVYARDDDPMVALLDDTLSVHGKPAAEVLWYWYAQLTGG